MKKKVNIIIPAITINLELLKCLKEINKIHYSNFFVTIVLNHDSKTKLPIGGKFELIDLQTGKTVITSYADKKTGEFVVSLPLNKKYALLGPPMTAPPIIYVGAESR